MNLGISKRDLAVRGVKLLHVALMVVSFAACWYLYYADHILYPYYRRGNWVIIAIFAVIYVFLNRVYEGYLISQNRTSETIYSLILALLLSDGFMFIVIWLVNKLIPYAIPLLLAFAVQAVITVAWSASAHYWYYKKFKPTPCVIVYNEFRDFEQLIYDYGYDNKFEVKKILALHECMQHLDILDEYKTVFLCDISSHERNVILKYCIMNGNTVYVLPRLGDVIMSGARSMHLFHMPLLRVSRYSPSPEYTVIKRAGDIVLSIFSLVLMSPLMLVVALCIKLTDRGPVFYRQERLTKNGKRFYLIKFRSMREDAEKDGVARLSTGSDDERITPVGRVIRKLRIDELPQLLNILKGEMSFIGPRPERPEIASQYEALIPEFSLRLQAKAGLTGYAQVYGKYNTTPYNKLEMDLMYIAHPSLLEDLRILLATIKIIFRPESTEGIDSGLTALSEEKEKEMSRIGALNNEHER